MITTEKADELRDCARKYSGELGFGIKLIELYTQKIETLSPSEEQKELLAKITEVCLRMERDTKEWLCDKIIENIR